MRDFLPSEVQAREKVLATVRGVFESYGFAPLQTPALERLEILQGKYGEEGERLIFKVLKRGVGAETGEADLALRYDLTVPMARVVAEYQSQIGRIFKRYQIAPVWRADRPGRGRFREFLQCDVDIVGPGLGLADAETVLVLSEALSAAGLKGFEVRLNSRKVLRGLIEAYGVDPAREPDVLTALDKLDRIGAEGVEKELNERSLSGAAKLLDGATGPLSELRDRLATSPVGREGLEEVDTVMDLVGPALGEGSITFSPVLARGLGYYTGPIFEIYAEGSTSAISAGGRYDNLVGMFSGRDIPAVGGSLGIERIIPLVTDPAASPARSGVLWAVVDPGREEEVLRSAAELRARGIPIEVYLGEPRQGLGAQLAYGSSHNKRFVVIRGQRERDAHQVSVKDLESGDQESIPEDGLVEYLSARS